MAEDEPLGNVKRRQVLGAAAAIATGAVAAGELVGALECFDAASSGAADMYHGAEYYWQGKSKAFSFFTAVPMGMTSGEIMAWVDHGDGQ